VQATDAALVRALEGHVETLKADVERALRPAGRRRGAGDRRRGKS
jgi:hypothetical protein